MKSYFNFIVIAFFILSTNLAFAASEQNLLQHNLQRTSEQESKIDILQGSDEELLYKMQQDNQHQSIEQVGLKKPQVVLFTESGDGLIKLKWNVVNLPVITDEQQLRFIIRYGIESEKLNKSLQIGKSQNYILRELKNNQPYYLQVIALDQGQQNLYKSEEVQVTPRPFDYLGSRLEKSFSQKNITMQDKQEKEPFQRELKQFGYDFFKNSSQLSQTIDSIPANDNYLLGPGDTLKLSIWGAVNAHYELKVDRNGEIVIPKVGSVSVWGIPFGEAKKNVSSAISKYFRNYEMNLSLGALRSVQVYVVGEIETPGSYPISSLSTVINALSVAGGPTKNGSLRSIKITRGGKTVEIVDLYDMLLSGDRSKDIRLENGDTIFVPVIGSTVAVAGEIKRPAIYELKENTTLKQIIDMAGGISAGGDRGRIQLERSSNSRKIVQDVISNSDNFNQITAAVTIQDRDMVKIFPIPSATRQVISVKGNVLAPGEYEFKPGMRLKDIISSTSILLPETYLEAVEIKRLSPPDYRTELMTVNLRAALNDNEKDNILLQEQDAIKVFSRWDMVEKPKVAVNGAVVNPGVYDYYPGMTVRDLVTAGGSARRSAVLDNAELSRISLNGSKAEPHRFNLDLAKALDGDTTQNMLLQPDDVLIVRTVADWVDASNKLVTLNGEVRYPGVYTIARGEKLSSLIERAGGYTDKAYLFGSKFTRKSVQKQQQKQMDEIILRTEKEITQKQAALASTAASKEELEATKATLEGLMQSLNQMKKLKAEGRVVMKLSPVNELKKGIYDIELEGGDSLDIPMRPAVVHVMGQVYNSTSFLYLSDSSNVTDYLNKAGGATNDGDESGIYVLRADGSVFSRQQSSFGIQWSDESKSWSFGGFMSKPLMPGDTIVVPQKIERTAWMRDIKDITQILANVAMTAGTVLIGLK